MVAEDEFVLEELGTIEEVSYRQARAEKRAKERKTSFYDRNSISKARPRSSKKEKQFYDKEPQQTLAEDREPERRERQDGPKQADRSQRRQSMKGREYYNRQETHHNQQHPASAHYMNRYQRAQYRGEYDYRYQDYQYPGNYEYGSYTESGRRHHNYLTYLEEENHQPGHHHGESLGYPRGQNRSYHHRDRFEHRGDRQPQKKRGGFTGREIGRHGDKRDYHYVKKGSDAAARREVVDLEKKDQEDKAQAPAGGQVRKDGITEEKQRDLRPAVFIKDLKKRSQALEEEKE